MQDITPKDVEKMLNKAYYIRYDNGEGLKSGMDIYKGTVNVEDQEHATHFFLNAGPLKDKELKYIKK
jgi:hypothetical protein